MFRRERFFCFIWTYLFLSILTSLFRNNWNFCLTKTVYSHSKALCWLIHLLKFFLVNGFFLWLLFFFFSVVNYFHLQLLQFALIFGHSLFALLDLTHFNYKILKIVISSSGKQIKNIFLILSAACLCWRRRSLKELCFTESWRLWLWVGWEVESYISVRL